MSNMKNALENEGNSGRLRLNLGEYGIFDIKKPCFVSLMSQ